jgi:hypothetical protein
VVRTAVPIRRVSVPGDDNPDAHFSGALHDRFKIVNLEPQQHSVTIWPVIAIANGAVMVFHFEAVQLKDKLAIRNQLLICRAPVIAAATEQTLIPSATCFHIGHGDQRLGTHTIKVSTAATQCYFAGGVGVLSRPMYTVCDGNAAGSRRCSRMPDVGIADLKAAEKKEAISQMSGLRVDGYTEAR